MKPRSDLKRCAYPRSPGRLGTAADGFTAAAFSSRSAPIALLVAGAFFMENLDGTVVVTAVPQMATAFGVHPIDLNIGVSAYLLTLAVLIPASGWAADRFGARRVFAGAIIVFSVASVLCGLSESLPAFTSARIMQGIGGAMMVPVGRLAILRSTEKRDLIAPSPQLLGLVLRHPCLDLRSAVS